MGSDAMEVQDRKVELWKRSRSVHWVDSRSQGSIDGQVTTEVEIEDRAYELRAELAVDVAKKARHQEFRRKNHEECVSTADALMLEEQEYARAFRSLEPAYIKSDSEKAEMWQEEYELQQDIVAEGTEFDLSGADDQEVEAQVQLESFVLKQVNAGPDARKWWDREEGAVRPVSVIRRMEREARMRCVQSVGYMLPFFDQVEEGKDRGVSDLFRNEEDVFGSDDEDNEEEEELPELPWLAKGSKQVMPTPSTETSFATMGSLGAALPSRTPSPFQLNGPPPPSPTSAIVESADMMASVADEAVRAAARVLSLSLVSPKSPKSPRSLVSLVSPGIEKPRIPHRRVTIGIEVRKNGRCRVDAQARWKREAERVKEGFPLAARCESLEEE